MPGAVGRVLADRLYTGSGSGFAEEGRLAGGIHLPDGSCADQVWFAIGLD